ncbi:MAG: hypothetical protein ABI574_04830 [Burkholderiales bacterium]
MSTQSPPALQPGNDLLGQQIAGATPGAVPPDTPHSKVTERYWYMGTLVPTGRDVFGAGFGYYPNKGIMDGYLGFTLDGVQHVYTASRRIGDSPLEPHAGALRITVQEPLRTHRIQLLENGSGLSADLLFHGALQPNDEGDDVLIKRDKLISSVRRFVQFGHYQGWIEVAGRKIDIHPEQCWGARDRSWGLRIEANTDETQPPVTPFKPLLFVWACIQFKDFGIHFFLKETAPGEVRFMVGDEAYPIGSGKPSRRITAIEHDLQWQTDPYSQHLSGGKFVLRFEDGSHRVIAFENLPGHFYLKAGLYGGLNGWAHGDDKGVLHTQYNQFDFKEPKVREKLRTLAEQVTRFHCDGAEGYGTIQSGVAEGYPMYQEVQSAPVM